MSEDERVEVAARCVREAWTDYCRETGNTKPSHLAPYDELSEWDKGADRAVARRLLAFPDPEKERWRMALETIANGDMPASWHPDNIAWWLRGVAREALKRPEWGYGDAALAGPAPDSE